MASSTVMSVHDITEKLRSHCIGALDDYNASSVKSETVDSSCQRTCSLNATCKVRHRSEPSGAVALADCSCHCHCGCARSDGGAHCRATFGNSNISSANVSLPLYGRQADVWLITSAGDAGQSACPPCKKPCRPRGTPPSGAADCLGQTGSLIGSQALGLPHNGSLQKPVALRPGSRQTADCHRRFAVALPSSSGLDTLQGTILTGSPLNGFDRTSPESPLLRPLSASSGFYDGSGSSLSGCSVTELSSSTDGPLRVALAAPSPRHNALGERCQSVEERPGVGSTSSKALVGSPVSFTSAVSLPSVAAASGFASAPSSPRRQRPPRCRSQPCDLQRERRLSGGVKRRHEDERPSLDFDKMTETAYECARSRASSCCRPKSSPMTVRCHCRHGDVRLSTLQTIASSPLDAATLPSTAGGYGRRSPLVSYTSPPGSPPLVAAALKEHHGSRQRGQNPLHDSSLCSSSGGDDDNASDHDVEDADISSGEHLFPIDLNGELDIEQIEQD